MPNLNNKKASSVDRVAGVTASGNRWINFALGFGVSGLLVGVFLSTSLWTTHTAWTDFGEKKLAIAFSIPLLCGILGLLFPKSMTALMNALSDISDVIPF